MRPRRTLADKDALTSRPLRGPQVNDDEDAYWDYRDRYRAMATELGFEGHMATAEAMT